jgi:hypothetical protein
MTKATSVSHLPSNVEQLVNEGITCSICISSILNKWLVFASPSGKLFYQNRYTQFCTWTKPPEGEATFECEATFEGGGKPID